MAVTAQSTIISWGVQADKDTLPTKYYQHRALSASLTEIDDVRMLDPEMGGVAVPEGAYKVGPMGNGDIVIQPRLAGSIGWLLRAGFGSVTTNTDTPVQDVNEHVFKFAATECLPYVAFRSHVKGGCEGVGDLGRVIYGGRVLGLQFDFTVEKPLVMSANVRAMNFQFEDPSSWNYENQMEHYASLPIGVQAGSYIKIPQYSSDPLPVVQASVALINTPGDVRFDRSYGQTGLDDITITDHVMTIDAVLKWKDPALYRTILTGSATGTSWNAQVFEQDFEAVAVAPGTIGSTSEHYKLVFSASRVVWRINGGLTLAGRDVIMLRLQGTVMNNAGGDYATLKLYNDVDSYA